MKFERTNFEQESCNTPEFLAFSKNFKKQLKKHLQQVGADLKVFSVGHFYISGFFTKNEKHYYFSFQNGCENLMYRTAKDIKDYTGASNQWVKLSEDMGSQLVLH